MREPSQSARRTNASLRPGEHHNLQLQKKVHEGAQETIGEERLPTLLSLNKRHYFLNCDTTRF